MSIERAIFSSIVRNTVQIKYLLAISIIGYINEDVLKTITSTMEIEVEPFYQPKISRGDFLEIVIKREGGDRESNSGTMRVDDVIYKSGKETYNIGATAIDYTTRKPDDVSVSYAGATLNNVVSTQSAYFSLTIDQPAGGIIPIIAGFYQGKANTRGEIARELEKEMQSIGSDGTTVGEKVFVIEADSRIEMLKLVGKMYGYAVNLKFGNLFFKSIDADLLHGRNLPIAYLLTPQKTLPGVEFRRKTKGIFSRAFVNYANRSGNRVLSIDNAEVKDIETAKFVTTDYIPPSKEIYPDEASAIARAIGLLVEANADRFSAFMEVEGNPILRAGAKVLLNGFDDTRDSSANKEIDGAWLIVKARHTFNTKGWFTYLELWKDDNVQMSF